MRKFLYQMTDKKFPTKNWKIRTLDDLLRKLRTITGLIECTVMINFKICSLYVVLVLSGSAETQLGWRGKFC